MPEYLAPGVYVEEVSFRAKSIEGVPTSTTGFAGLTRYGPVQYAGGPTTTEPRLITSFTEFERVYGGLEPLDFDDRLPYVAHAARAFFMNGGKRLYVSRVFVPKEGTTGVASRAVPLDDPDNPVATWRARWPGSAGNVFVETKPVWGKNIAFTFPEVVGDPLARHTWGVQAKGAKDGAVVQILPPPVDPADLPGPTSPLLPDQLHVVRVDADGRQTFLQGGAKPVPAGSTILLVQLQVTVHVADRVDTYQELGADRNYKRHVGVILQRDHPQDEDAAVWLDFTPGETAPADESARFLIVGLCKDSGRLTGGDDGAVIDATALAGEEADLDNPAVRATGLAALGEIDDIAIVAAPDGGTLDTADSCAAMADALITHAELLRYRIAVVDAPEGSALNQVRDFRGRFDSTRAALYHPWIEVFDPLDRPAQGAPPKRIMLPPSGFVTGIYARSDIERGVFKAPANEVVRGLTRFEANINKARQDVLNPEGINALRFFEGRGSRVWGARTMSSDPEWKYVNVRRLFIFLEHSIDKSTQWAVFEPNNYRLWANIRHTVEDFLLLQWRDGALMGTKPEEAYFVRCDRTTMTQNDLDNGRLICLIGVAPTKPAEFVIFRIGQWTADANQ